MVSIGELKGGSKGSFFLFLFQTGGFKPPSILILIFGVFGGLGVAWIYSNFCIFFIPLCGCSISICRVYGGSYGFKSFVG